MRVTLAVEPAFDYLDAIKVAANHRRDSLFNGTISSLLRWLNFLGVSLK